MNFFKIFMMLSLACSIVLISCEDDNDSNSETCSDGIQNQDETGIDCGGVCTACTSCSDGIQNGDETGVDCGGSCPDACVVEETCTDGIQNQDETGIDCGGATCPPCTPTGEYIIGLLNGTNFAANLVLGFDDGTTLGFQSDQSQDNQLFFEVPTGTVPGTYDLMSTGFSARYAIILGNEYTTESGSITITHHDTNAQSMYGTFEFQAVAYSFGNPIDTMNVTMGEFGVEYNN